MILEKLSLINYKNIRVANLELSPKINCLIGQNGVGKTNVLDAIYFLSFCHSASNPIDSQVITHDEGFFLIEGMYQDDLCISCGMKRGTKKHFKLMDVVISQYDRSYIDAMNRYNKALLQRNTMLKQEEEPDVEVLRLWEEQMAIEGERIFACRDAFVKALTPVFQRYYETISGHREQVEMTYISHCQRGPLLEVIQRDRQKDRIMGYSLHGVHRDDLVFSLGGHPMKREGSQGQHKTFVIALKLAQFDFLKRTNNQTTPLLLLDDIFDKLDADRVEEIVKLVASDEFGQIFITDTNREHLDQILSRTSHDYRIFQVENGNIHV